MVTAAEGERSPRPSATIDDRLGCRITTYGLRHADDLELLVHGP